MLLNKLTPKLFPFFISVLISLFLDISNQISLAHAKTLTFRNIWWMEPHFNHCQAKELLKTYILFGLHNVLLRFYYGSQLPECETKKFINNPNCKYIRVPSLYYISKKKKNNWNESFSTYFYTPKILLFISGKTQKKIQQTIP